MQQYTTVVYSILQLLYFSIRTWHLAIRMSFSYVYSNLVWYSKFSMVRWSAVQRSTVQQYRVQQYSSTVQYSTVQL